VKNILKTSVEVVLLCSLALLAAACERKQARTNSPVPDRSQPDLLFQKKLECGKLLARIPGSELGPDIRQQKGVLPVNPIVFYNPSLNTCLYLKSFVVQGRQIVSPFRKFNIRHISVEDLLTGQTVAEPQEFDLDVPGQAQAANAFEEQMIKRYEAVK
jgi:hypothetical protein